MRYSVVPSAGVGLFAVVLLSTGVFSCKKAFPCKDKTLPPAIASLRLPDVQACKDPGGALGYLGIVRRKTETQTFVSLVRFLEKGGWKRTTQTGHNVYLIRGQQKLKVFVAGTQGFRGNPVTVSIKLEKRDPKPE